MLLKVNETAYWEYEEMKKVEYLKGIHSRKVKTTPDSK